MKKNTIQKKFIAILLSLSMIISMSGCGQKDDSQAENEKKEFGYNGVVNATVDSESKWVNSSIYEAIDEKLQVSEKDDFYSAVNKDWILAQDKPTDDNPDTNIFTSCEDKIKERLISIVSGQEDPEAYNESKVNINPEEIEHDKELVMRLTRVSSDWDSRNKLGCEPIKRYIDCIENIKSVDELSAYICDMEKSNFSQDAMISVVTAAGIIEAGTYKTIIMPQNEFALTQMKPYVDMNITGRQAKRTVEDMVRRILPECGYSQTDIDRILKECYRYEGMLIDHMNMNMEGNIDNYSKGYSLDELQKLAGDYPVSDVIRAYGYSVTDDFRMPDTGYLKYLSGVYNENNLELIKSYYVVHTICDGAVFLDRECFELATEYMKIKDPFSMSAVPDGDGDTKDVETRDSWDEILNYFIRPYLAGPMDIVYISKYCSDEDKKEIIDLVDEIISQYHTMIDNEKWLTASAKAAANEKLDYLTVRVLYPDNFDTYLDLVFEEDDDILDMIQKVNYYQKSYSASLSGTKVDRDAWDLDDVSTTVANAYYKPNDNSINILAGMISTGEAYSLDYDDEINMAKLGAIIGHEISHGFDSTGCYYDKLGNQQKWWDDNEMETFELKVRKMALYYNTLSPYPGGTAVKGVDLTGEAIADMGGMSVLLGKAKSMPDFDYDLFFRSYAELWRDSCSYAAEITRADTDVHPQPFLRTNVTLAQFDEFVDTYNIKAGDGMYISEDKRVKIW